jgi:hypothetical protein
MSGVPSSYGALKVHLLRIHLLAKILMDIANSAQKIEGYWCA